MNERKNRIILLEDDPIISWNIITQLESFGIEVNNILESKNGLLDLEVNRNDLIVTNLRLFDGWLDEKFFHYLKTKGTTVLILTGLSSNAVFYKSILGNKTHFLYKPYTTRQLKRKLSMIKF